MPNGENRDLNPEDESRLEATAAEEDSSSNGDDDDEIDWTQVYPTVSQPLQVATMASTVFFIVHVVIIIVFDCLPVINGILAAVHLILAIYFFSRLRAVSTINARYETARSRQRLRS